MPALSALHFISSPTRWQEEISELVHDLIVAAQTVHDDANNYDHDLRRKCSARKHTQIEQILADMHTWLSFPGMHDLDHGCRPASSEEVRWSKVVSLGS